MNSKSLKELHKIADKHKITKKSKTDKSHNKTSKSVQTNKSLINPTNNSQMIKSLNMNLQKMSVKDFEYLSRHIFNEMNQKYTLKRMSENGKIIDIGKITRFSIVRVENKNIYVIYYVDKLDIQSKLNINILKSLSINKNEFEIIYTPSLNKNTSIESRLEKPLGSTNSRKGSTRVILKSNKQTYYKNIKEFNINNEKKIKK